MSGDARHDEGKSRGHGRRMEQQDDIFRILSHPVRRSIVLLLHERIEMTYSELLRELKLEEGLFNFHLRNMRPLLETTENGSYILSKTGRLAYELIKRASREQQLNDVLPTPPPLNKDIVTRRVSAFLIDVLVFFIATGAFLDPNIHHLIQLHWLDVQQHATEIILAYSHIFFAAFITFTLLESYKGQTLGKFISGIRVVSVSDRRLTLIESGIRNIGKVFLLPIDLLIGLSYYRKGYIRFFDFYVKCKTELV